VPQHGTATVSTYVVEFCHFLAGNFGRSPQVADYEVVKRPRLEIERLSPKLSSETFYGFRVVNIKAVNCIGADRDSVLVRIAICLLGELSAFACMGQLGTKGNSPQAAKLA